MAAIFKRQCIVGLLSKRSTKEFGSYKTQVGWISVNIITCRHITDVGELILITRP